MKLTEQKLLQICKHEEFEQAEIKDYLHQLFHHGSVTTSRGEIKFCKRCEDFVQTTCSSCGCGNCKKCDSQWTCYEGFKANPTVEESNDIYKTLRWAFPDYL